MARLIIMNTKTPKTKKVPDLKKIIQRLEKQEEAILYIAATEKSIDMDIVNRILELGDYELPLPRLVPKKKSAYSGKEETITFPKKTAKQIIEECDNKVAGGKLLWNIGWFKNEDFYKKETCRPRTIKIPTEILHAGKSWNECKELIGEEKMFNYAEIIYMLRESESFRKLLSSDNSVCYTWTSSRASDGRLAFSGDFDSGGVYSGRWRPGSSVSLVGVCVSK